MGDTLFSIGCGRVIEGNPEMMWNSLLKLRALPDATRFYCGHEYTDANIETFFGRRRYFDGIRSPIPFVRASAERMAIFNAPMQGTSADVVKLAMIKIDELFEREAKGKAYQLLQVHDELVFEIEEGLVDDLAPKIKELMEGVIPQKDALGIPFSTEGKVGKNWGEMKKL